jgi:hypothetical protein
MQEGLTICYSDDIIINGHLIQSYSMHANEIKICVLGYAMT